MEAVEATTAVAIYAALVASGGAAIQLAQWHGTRTRVRLEVHAGTASILTEEHDPYGNRVSAPGEVLFSQITNRSPHAVKIVHLGAMPAGWRPKRGLFFSRPYPQHIELPLEVPARDSVTLWQPRSNLAKWERQRMRVVVKTATGESFRSKRFLLDRLTRLETLP